MTLQPGAKLGPYEIAGSLGAGGMGEVYKATDTRLDRTVAIKVLPGHLAGDADLRERFDREARAISALNHPNICALYDVGHQDGIDYLVMEYLEGEPLVTRLAKGPLPIADALRYGVEVASALDKAHRAGIIHRDLKPGNIVITKAGAKLLDFGLAKRQAGSAAVAGATALATTPPELTARGSILGTFQYMAPEQLEGAEADARSDIFALGAVLYEMATGRKAFEGKTQASLIAAIIDRDPAPLTTVVAVAPAGLERIIKVALAKDPDDRWQTARDVVRELRELSTTVAPPASTVASAAVAVQKGSRAREYIAWSVAAVALLAAVVLGWRAVTPRPDVASVTRFIITTPPKTDFVTNTILAVSPNGRFVVFTAGAIGEPPKLWLRSMDASEPVPIANTDGGGVPFWSPDSRFIAFFADAKLKKISIAGGPPQVLCDAPVPGANRGGGVWNRNDVIVFQPNLNGPLFRVAAAGGIPAQVTKLDEKAKETVHRYPSFLPDDKHFLFVAQPGGHIIAAALDSDQRKEIMQADSKPVFVAPNHLLFVRQNVVMRQAFDPGALQLSGDAVPVGQPVRTNAPFGSAAFSVSDNGVLVFGGGLNTQQSRAEWLDRDGGGNSTVAIEGMYDYRGIALSPDGRRVAVHRHEGTGGGGGGGIWITDLDRSVTSRFTLTDAHEADPVWSPDGRQIAFSSVRDAKPGIFVKASDGSGQERQIVNASTEVLPTDWSLNGNSIAYQVLQSPSGPDLFVLTLGGDDKSRRVTETKFVEGGAQVSPDGRFLAYHSNESGRFEIYVQSLGADGSKWQVSTGTGIYPRWRRDGTELYYLSVGEFAIQVVPMNLRNSQPVAGTARVLIRSRIVATPNGFPYAVTPDGKRFLVANGIDNSNSTLTVVMNWTATLPTK